MQYLEPVIGGIGAFMLGFLWYTALFGKAWQVETGITDEEAQKDMMSVKSQINGVVDEVFQRKGEIAGPSLPFARVVNIDKVYINTEVGEKFLGTINKGDATEIYAATELAKKVLKWEAKLGLKSMIQSSWDWEQNLRNE